MDVARSAQVASEVIQSSAFAFMDQLGYEGASIRVFNTRLVGLPPPACVEGAAPVCRLPSRTEWPPRRWMRCWSCARSQRLSRCQSTRCL
jgi:hypothetical protein